MRASLCTTLSRAASTDQIGHKTNHTHAGRQEESDEETEKDKGGIHAHPPWPAGEEMRVVEVEEELALIGRRRREREGHRIRKDAPVGADPARS